MVSLSCFISHNQGLISSFTLEEIKRAVGFIGKNEAPGPDGYTVEFFLKNWDIFKSDFQKLVEEFFKKGKLNACLKENFICLIHKKGFNSFCEGF